MIIYNVTVRVDPAIAADWLQWQLEEHIPAVLRCGLFTDYRCFRLLEQDDEEGITYVTQFHCTGLEEYQRYLREFSPHRRQEAFDKWGDRYIAFRTVMESVH